MLRLWGRIATELTVGKSCVFCSLPVLSLSYFNSCRQEVGSTSEEIPFFLLYFYYFETGTLKCEFDLWGGGPFDCCPAGVGVQILAHSLWKTCCCNRTNIKLCNEWHFVENKTCAAGLNNAVIFLVAEIREMNCWKHLPMCVYSQFFNTLVP